MSSTWPELPNNVKMSVVIGRLTAAELTAAVSKPAGIVALIQLLSAGAVVDVTSAVASAPIAALVTEGAITKARVAVILAPLVPPVAVPSPVSPA